MGVLLAETDGCRSAPGGEGFKVFPILLVLVAQKGHWGFRFFHTSMACAPLWESSKINIKRTNSW
jgi:hypothetical protein